MALERRLKLLPSSDEVPEEQALTVAFASTDRKTVNQHFGSAESFVVHAVTPDEIRMVEVLQFGSLAQDGNEHKLIAKLQALQGCAAVYCQAVGSSAIAQLRTIGVQPMRVDAGTPIPALLEGLKEELRAGPSVWIRKAIRSQTASPARFDEMDAEGWCE